MPLDVHDTYLKFSIIKVYCIPRETLNAKKNLFSFYGIFYNLFRFRGTKHPYSFS